MTSHIGSVKGIASQGAGREIDYDVEDVGFGFGTITRLLIEGELVALADRGAPCFDVLYNRPTLCEGCPVFQVGESHQRTLIRRCDGPHKGASARFEITSVKAVRAGAVQLRVRCVSDSALQALQAAKVRMLVDAAGLSRREAEVLNYLLLGSSIEDIGRLTKISPRTVKHHQANILQKLGADSRVDLLRVLL